MINHWLETKFPDGTIGRLVPTVGLKPNKKYAYYESEIDAFGTVHFVFCCWESISNPEWKWEEVTVTEATVRLITTARKFQL